MNRRNFGIGIDIGGTKTAIASVAQDGVLSGKIILPTEADRGFERALQRISDAVEQLIQGVRETWCGIGIGCTGPVNPLRGTIHNPYTLPTWDGCDIVTPLRERFGVPVHLENDADAAALGECIAGAGRDQNPVVMLTFGTGIGGSVIVDGNVFRGAAGEHPELGHIPVTNEGPSCYCGRAGCLESIASGTAIEMAGRDAGFANSRETFAAAIDGNSVAKKIIDRAIEAANSAAWTIIQTYLPQRILLGGGVMEDHFDLFAPAMRKAIASAVMAPRDSMSVAKAELGNDAGLVGAAWLALRELK